MSSDFRFIDALPSAPSERRGDPLLADFADALRARPGEWAQYPYPSTPEGARSMAARIRRGRGPKPLREDFDACTRRGVVYVRHERPSK